MHDSSSSTTARLSKVVTLAAAVLVLAIAAGPAYAADSDGDRMSNRWERANGLNPYRANDDGSRDGDEEEDNDEVDNEDEDDLIEPCPADDDDRDEDGLDDEDENDV